MLKILIAAAVVNVVLSNCPSGTVYNSDSNMCYKYVKSAQAFVDAESDCRDIGGHLTSVQNGFINSEIHTMATNFFGCSGQYDYWIGGNTLESQSWQWIDGTPFSYNNWAPGQGSPPSPNQCISATVLDGRWNAATCDVTKPFVCAIPDTPTSGSCTTQKPMNSPGTCPPPPERCDDGWTHYSPTGSCYKTLHNTDFWSAENNCILQGAHLTSIHSPQENQFILDLSESGQGVTLNDPYVWIGLHYDGAFKWTDGTPFDYEFWAAGQPSPISPGVCVEFIADLRHDDVTANLAKWWISACGRNQRAYVCKKKAIH